MLEFNRGDEKLESLAEDLKKNPPVSLDLSVDMDPKKHKEFFEHKCQYHGTQEPATGAIGGAVSYIITGTSIGRMVKARCACGKEEDLTDYRLI